MLPAPAVGGVGNMLNNSNDDRCFQDKQNGMDGMDVPPKKRWAAWHCLGTVSRMRRIYEYHDLSVEQQGVLSRASRSPYDKLHRKAPKHDPVSLVHGPLCQRDSEDNDGMIFRLEVFLL